MWPFSDAANGAELRQNTQRMLKETYVDPIVEIARMTTRAPIANINHDPRFVAAASERAKSVENGLVGFHAMGAYVALELRVRGCVVIHGSSFWSKMAVHMTQSSNGYRMLSWEPAGDGDEHLRLWRAFAIYEKQLFTEKMVSVSFMDPDKIRDWDENITVPMLSQQEFSEIWEDRGKFQCQWEWMPQGGLMPRRDRTSNPERRATV